MESVWIPYAPYEIQEQIGSKVTEAYEKKELANQIESEAIQQLEMILENGEDNQVVKDKDIKEEEKKVFITLNINEGPRTKVKRIQILGNDHIPEKKIKAKMNTKEAHLFRRGIFGEEEFKKDLDRA